MASNACSTRHPLRSTPKRLLDEFAKGSANVGDEWQTALTPENLTVVEALAADADTALAGGHFMFPDEVWARIVYDMAIAWHERRLPLDRLVTALIPLYFGRVASLILETTDLTTDQAEAFVERQARVFELTKPYLVDRWKASGKAGPAAGSSVGRARAARTERPSMSSINEPSSSIAYGTRVRAAGTSTLRVFDADRQPDSRRCVQPESRWRAGGIVTRQRGWRRQRGGSRRPNLGWGVLRVGLPALVDERRPHVPGANVRIGRQPT